MSVFIMAQDGLVYYLGSHLMHSAQKTLEETLM